MWSLNNWLLSILTTSLFDEYMPCIIHLVFSYNASNHSSIIWLFWIFNVYIIKYHTIYISKLEIKGNFVHVENFYLMKKSFNLLAYTTLLLEKLKIANIDKSKTKYVTIIHFTCTMDSNIGIFIKAIHIITNIYIVFRKNIFPIDLRLQLSNNTTDSING